jgi:putative ABC transport system permease protein
VEAWLQDLRLSIRVLRKNPGITVIAVLCMALGIGANTTVYSIVEGVLLRPFPFADPDRIVGLHRSHTHDAHDAHDPSGQSFSYPDFFDLRGAAATLSPIAAYTDRSLTLAGDEPERVQGATISAELFPLLGVAPALGRGFRPDDDQPGAPGAILLGNDLWHRRYHADPAVIGRVILVNAMPYTVVGVMPARFRFPEKVDAWVPLAPIAHANLRTYRDLNVLARLRPGIGPDQAGADLAAFARRQAALYPAIDTGWDATLLPLREELQSEGQRRFVLTLLGAVLFVLMIACANVANLQLARAADRQREVAVRLAFGAGRGRIARQLLTESLLLALGGAALGTLLAVWGLQLTRAAIPASHPMPYWIHLDLDGPVLLATLLAAVGTGLLFGLAPALAASRSELQEVLKEGGRTTGAGRGRQRLRGALVVVEIALALTLLIGTSLFTRSFLKLRQDSGGLGTTRLLALRVYMPDRRYDAGAKTRRVEDLVRRIEALPGVEQAGASNLVPLDGGGEGALVAIEGREMPRGAEPSILYAGVTSHFFRSLGAALLAGRGFTDREAGERTPIAVVNATLARRFWHGEAAVGRRFRLLDIHRDEWLTVVGVVADFKGEGIDEKIKPSAYLPFPYMAMPNTGLVVRTRVSPGALAATVRRAVHASDPGLPVFAVATLEELRSSSYWAQRLFSSMFGVFGAVALCLAAIGIYGVLAYNVSQRRREIGVRVALGARHRHILGLVLGQALALALGGIACGLAAAFGVTRVIGQLLYEVSPTDPASFAGIAIFLAGVALLASALPARSALDADPLEALRQE